MPTHLEEDDTFQVALFYSAAVALTRAGSWLSVQTLYHTPYSIPNWEQGLSLLSLKDFPLKPLTDDFIFIHTLLIISKIDFWSENIRIQAFFYCYTELVK